jgi:hypothetical protein
MSNFNGTMSGDNLKKFLKFLKKNKENITVLRTYPASDKIKELKRTSDKELGVIVDKVDALQKELSVLAEKASAVKDEFWSNVSVELGLYGKKLQWNDKTKEIMEYVVNDDDDDDDD